MGGVRDDLNIHEKALDILIELLKKEQVSLFEAWPLLCPCVLLTIVTSCGRAFRDTYTGLTNSVNHLPYPWMYCMHYVCRPNDSWMYCMHYVDPMILS